MIGAVTRRAWRVDRRLGGRRDSLDADGMAALQASGVPMDYASADKDESDTELAVRGRHRRVAASRGSSSSAGLGAHASITRSPTWVAGDGGAGGMDAPSSTQGRGIKPGCRAPEPTGLPIRRELSGRVGDIVSLLPLGPGWPASQLAAGVSAGDEPLPAGPARGLSNVRHRPTPP